MTAVVMHLRMEGWEMEITALATQYGDGIVATRDGECLVIEPKGEGSSKSHTKRFVSPFSREQASTHIAVTILRSLRAAAESTTSAVIVLPDVDSHRREVDRVAPALSKIGIRV